MRRTSAVVALCLLFVGCTTNAPNPNLRARTPKEADAYRAFDRWWNAGGPGTPFFVPIEEGGVLYAVMDTNSAQQFEAVNACLKGSGVTPVWGFPPSQMGKRR